MNNTHKAITIINLYILCYFAKIKAGFLPDSTEIITYSKDFIFQQSTIKQTNPRYVGVVKKIDFSITRKAIKTLQNFDRIYDKFCDSYKIKTKPYQYGNMKLIFGETTFYEARTFCKNAYNGKPPEIRTKDDLQNILVVMSEKENIAFANVDFNMKSSQQIFLSDNTNIWATSLIKQDTGQTNIKYYSRNWYRNYQMYYVYTRNGIQIKFDKRKTLPYVICQLPNKGNSTNNWNQCNNHKKQLKNLINEAINKIDYILPEKLPTKTKNNKHIIEKRSTIGGFFIGSAVALLTNAIVDYFAPNELNNLSKETERKLGQIQSQTNELGLIINKLQKQILNVLEEVNTKILKQNILQFDNYINLKVTNIINSLYYQANIINDMFIAAHKDTVTINAITPNELLTLENGTNTHLYTDIEYIKSKIANDGTCLFLILKIPEINKLMNSRIVTPIPFPTFTTNKTKYIPLSNTKPFIVTNYDTIAWLYDNEQNQCLLDKYFCTTRAPFYNLQKLQNCMTKQFSGFTNPCNYTLSSDSINFFYSGTDSILFSVKESINIMIICKTNTSGTVHKKAQTITGKGKIFVPDKCIVKTEDVTLFSNIQNGKSLWLQNNNILPKIDIPKINYTQFMNKKQINLDKIRNLSSYQIKEFHYDPSTNPITYVSIYTLLFLLILFFILILLFKQIRTNNAISASNNTFRNFETNL